MRARWYVGYENVDQLIHIPRSECYKRVARLPQEKRGNLLELAKMLTRALKKPDGTMELWPDQAAMLQCLYDHGGALGSMGCGAGKTLVTVLAPVLVQARKAILVVPAKLKQKTVREFRELSEHWKEARIDLVSYEFLSRNKDYLGQKKPDLLVGDEIHKLKNPRAAVTRQVDRYLTSHPECRFLGMSGTQMKRSILDFHHMTRWAGGLDGMPLPHDRQDVKAWARAIDEDPPGSRLLPGWLSQFCDRGELPSRDNVQRGVGRRIFETPGFYRTTTASFDASIIMERMSQNLPAEVTDKIAQMKETKQTPCGDEALPSDIWRHTRELCLGFYYTWDPKPPEKWLAARRIWRSFVREIIEADMGWDSELQVAHACKSGNIKHHGRYARWVNIRDTFKINTVPVWITDKILRGMIGDDGKWWNGDNSTLIWVEHRAVGEKLVELTRLRYFREGGRAEDGTQVEELAGQGSAILSIGANFEGRNLQAWNYNVVLTPPTTGRTWEQMIARTHRPGQMADEVFFRTYVGQDDALEQALRDAKVIHNVTGQPQRLQLADMV